MGTFSADWISLIVVGFGTLFLIGELLVNMRGVFGLLGVGFITLYFLTYLDPSMFVLMMVIYFIGILLIIIDGKIINDGTLATIGAVCMILSVGLSSPNWTAGLYAIIGVLLGGGSSLAFLRVFKHRKLWSKLTLVDQLTDENGYSTVKDTHRDLLGQKGITITDMRPVGTIRVNEQEYSAVSSGQWIAKQTEVKVTHVDGTKILVSKIN
ncbi:NfeD family protein [Aquibacillus sediminis]|uniref:NfeD family protein n=1 Tax=Aquibacillus sediminis TaxID=2574734 RepID=UPI001108665D|nr:NfeD family protein [Aquibacillus sediminis]